MSLWPNDECQILPLTDRRGPGWKLDFKGRARDLSCPEQAVPQGLVAQNRLQMSTAARRSRDARGAFVIRGHRRRNFETAMEDAILPIPRPREDIR